MASKHTCSICLNNFTKPKLLPCHHTFCQQCIDGLIRAHAHSNKFNCPTCRQKTVVPSGGASQFVTNFYLEDNDDDNTDKQYCTKHKKKEVQVYCRDCRKPCCSVCVIVDHKDHTVADLDEVDLEMGEIVMNLKTESEKKKKQLQEHSDFLKTKISHLNQSCKTACDIVDKQIDDICEKVRKIGGTIKDDINKIGKDQNKKLTKLVEDVDKMTSEIKEWCEYADRILQHKSIITAVDKDGLTDIQTKTDYDVSTKLQKPLVKFPCYYMEKIDVNRLNQLFGEVHIPTLDELPVKRLSGDPKAPALGGTPVKPLSGDAQAPALGGKPVKQLSGDAQAPASDRTPVKRLSPTTFTSSFSLNQMTLSYKNYYSDTVIIQGLPWCVRVQIKKFSHVQDRFYIDLILKEVEDKTIKTVTACYTLKLLNIKDETKSIVRHDKRTFTPGSIYTGVFVDCDKLANTETGYIDDNQTFTAQATVNITDIIQY